ncbi:MAG: tripartite tricarboxylate transporter substrate binding protein BugD [Afipia sp.]|nr:tripartite tricarboxylate transporter substrate binding protein BugD [Afipia sp.]
MAVVKNRKGNKKASLIASAAIAAAMTFVGIESGRAADDWPSRPITMINPFAAGGPNDVPARMFAQRMGEVLGQQVIVENVGGAGGMIGAQRVAKAAPDGYTFLVGTVGTQAQNQLLYKKPAYDATKDFTSVGLFLEAPLVLVARKDFPASNLKDFVAYAKQNGSKMQFASAGTGSAIHLGCALLNSVTGIDVVHVPYRGANPAMQDLASGRVDYLCDIVTTAKPQIDGGAIKPIAILTDARSPALPNVPTAVEQGFDVKAYTWNAYFLPKGTPEAIVTKLNKAMLAAMHDPAIKQKLESAGLRIVPDDRATPQYLDGFVKSEIEKWSGPIKAIGVQID